MDNKLTVEHVVKAIHVPVDEWPGNCYAIASMMIAEKVFDNIPGMAGADLKLRYGHWTGYIARDTIFSSRAIISHGWIEIPPESLPGGGLIVDPTRWYFEGVTPYIFVGINDHYDIGGSGLRNALHDIDPPACVEGDGRFRYPASILKATVKSILKCNCDENRMSIDQMFWLGNMDPRTLEPHTKDIYLWLGQIGQKASVPIDYWLMYMEN